MPADEGRQIRPGALVRADALHQLTECGIEAFRSYGVVRIIDLRNAAEAEDAPSPFTDNPIYRFSPMIDPEADRTYDRYAEPSLASVYCGSLTRNASHIAAAIADIADAPPGCVVVHCSAGKDRTGMIVALALKVAGVADATIADDYAYTQVCLSARLDALLATAADRDHVLAWKGATATTMRTMLDHLEAELGGVNAYLAAIGVAGDQITRLRQRLTS